MACCERGERKWFVRGKGVPRNLWPVDRLNYDSDSVAAALLIPHAGRMATTMMRMAKV